MLLGFKFLKKYKTYFAATIATCLLLIVGGGTNLSYLLGANSLAIVSHEPFDGTVYPYEAAADWVSLSETERSLTYSQLSSKKKLPPLFYNETELALGFDSLDFGSTKGDKIRNSKITYSVPYLGTYKLDGKAGTGSHGAVDIKLHMETPLFAIANGVVVKVDDRTTGFGHHIVVRHNNVPDLDNPGQTTTYLSSYSHMDSFKVELGDKVRKGQLIGFSGNTGTSTTPHLHFQIDKVDAPFYPYWGFTNADLNEAGLSFFEGVNEGLKQDNFRKYTVNPMDFVQANLNFVSEENGDASIPETENENTETEEVKVIDDKPEDNSLNLSFRTPEFVLLGEEVEMFVDTDSNLATASGSEVNKIELDSTLRSEIEFPSTLAKGENRIRFTGKELGEVNLSLNIGSETYTSRKIEVRPFKDVSAFDKDVRELTSLKKARIMEGVDGNLFPEEEVTRAASLKFLIETLSVASPRLMSDLETVSLDFDDTLETDWFNEYITKSVAINSVSADQENFNPGRAVILPELLKMFFEGMNADLDENVSQNHENSFDTSAWYAKYLQEGLNRNIINTKDLSDISKPLTRREVALISYKFLSLIETGRYAY